MTAPAGITRRAFTAALAASCLPQWLAAAASGENASAAPRFAGDAFALGVASGEPAADGCVIWTRLVGVEPFSSVVAVDWEVAADERFARVIARGRHAALPQLAHAVHVELRGLQPGRDYWYRFRAGTQASRHGRTRTVPARPQRLRYALASCQNWDHGYFSAYRDMLAQELDVVLHVGDYIYERTWGPEPYVRPHGLPEATDLESYRRRHAHWKTDPDLQAAHAALPFIVTWDDHEVANDYAGTDSGAGEPAERFARRRAEAYQAYFEHMPLRPSSLLAGGGLQLYRRFRWGELANLHVLDSRQYRSDQPCATPVERSGRPISGCAEALAPERSLLGAAQEAWLRDDLARDPARWSLLVQQVILAQLDTEQGPGQTLWSDFWDGYAASRARLLEALRVPAVRNAVVLGGDLHSFWASDIKADFLRPESPTVASEFLTTCLASRNPGEERLGRVLENNPHVRAMDRSCSGYLLFDVDGRRAAMQLRAVSDLADPAARCATRAAFVVEDGRPGPQAA